jgi:hypothetical protein
MFGEPAFLPTTPSSPEDPTINLVAAINANTTPVELKIWFASPHIRLEVNGIPYTGAGLDGSGGNDASGAPVLTGGFPGILIYHNSGF